MKEYSEDANEAWKVQIQPVPKADMQGDEVEYTIVRGPVTLEIAVKNGEFTKWEVSYRAKQQE